MPLARPSLGARTSTAPYFSMAACFDFWRTAFSRSAARINIRQPSPVSCGIGPGHSLIDWRNSASSCSSCSWVSPLSINRRQAALQVSDQVGLGLEPDRQAEQAVRNAGCTSRLRPHPGVCHCRRMRNQALDAAERFGKGEHADRVDEPAHGFDSTLQLEAQHGPKSVLLARGESMAGVSLEAGIVDRRNQWVPS